MCLDHDADLIKMELKMKAVCEGRRTKMDVVQETIEQYRAVYVRSAQRFDMLRRVSCCFVRRANDADIVAVDPEIRARSISF